jgi:hypothetical protein
MAGGSVCGGALGEAAAPPLEARSRGVRGRAAGGLGVNVVFVGGFGWDAVLVTGGDGVDDVSQGKPRFFGGNWNVSTAVPVSGSTNEAANVPESAAAAG